MEQGQWVHGAPVELPSLRRHRQSCDGSPPKFQQRFHSMHVPGEASSSELGRLCGRAAWGTEPWGRTTLRSATGEASLVGTHHLLLRSTAALTSSLQPGWTYLYSNRSVSRGVAKLLKTGDPSHCIACSNSSKEALGLTAVQDIYWHNYSCSL